jgi:uncharacterized protein YecE (DUF72 family)
MGELYIGTQGFSFKDWVGSFYPPDTTPDSYLEIYSSQFHTVEVDSTFYGIPKATTVAGWRRRTPQDFRFSAKFPQVITHKRMLIDCEQVTEHFVRVMEGLGEKLGPLLLQFSYKFEPDRIDHLLNYLDALPTDLKFAVEIRNRDWYDTSLCDALKERGVALALHDLYYMPRREEVTADFVYVRWLGRRAGLKTFDRVQLDRRDEETWWAERTSRFLDQGLTVYGYFNNHWAGHSPASARGFLERLGQHVDPLDPTPRQPRLL